MLNLENLTQINFDSFLFNFDKLRIKFDHQVLQNVINWQLAKKRSGCHKTKGISDISGTTRKPYRQKGTGRARQGSLRSPQFRGGAVIFGPVVRSHNFSLNKKVRKLGLKMAVYQRLNAGQIFLIKDDLLPSLNNLTISKNCKNKISILLSTDSNVVLKNSKNYYINRVSCTNINVYSIIQHDYIILTNTSLKYLNEKLA